MNLFEYLIMLFKIGNNILVLPNLSNHGMDYCKAMRKRKSKLCLELLYFSLISKKYQFSILYSGFGEVVFAAIKQ